MSTHQQLLYHIVFSTKERRPLLKDATLRESTWKYMAGIATNLEGHALRIGGYIDHAHLLLRIPAKIAVADFMQHHSKRTFQDEYLQMLKDHEVEFDPKYLWE